MKNSFGLNQSEYEMLLAADVDELHGVGDSVVAVLVRSDGRVQRAAMHLLMRMQDVDAAVGSLAGAGAAARPPYVLPLRRRVPRAVRATILSGGLAAAALAAVLIYRDSPTPSAPPRTPVPAEAPLTATINASSDRPFAVIPTNNPDIAIVWLFNKDMK